MITENFDVISLDDSVELLKQGMNDIDSDGGKTCQCMAVVCPRVFSLQDRTYPGQTTAIS